MTTTTGGLIGMRALMEYLGVSRQVVHELLALGLPAAKLGGRWISHGEAIERWFLELLSPPGGVLHPPTAKPEGGVSPEARPTKKSLRGGARDGKQRG